MVELIKIVGIISYSYMLHVLLFEWHNSCTPHSIGLIMESMKSRSALVRPYLS